jgi:hypothetical protein
LVAQQDVLEDEVPARAHPGNDACEPEPDEFEHVLSIADLPLARGLPPDNLATLPRSVVSNERTHSFASFVSAALERCPPYWSVTATWATFCESLPTRP